MRISRPEIDTLITGAASIGQTILNALDRGPVILFIRDQKGGERQIHFPALLASIARQLDPVDISLKIPDLPLPITVMPHRQPGLTIRTINRLFINDPDKVSIIDRFALKNDHIR